ncbi:bifunctional diguanylate cyclase/phosphodiesterase [Salinarimonas ramus]|uniref:Signaling protein n=1 Tax=Salinarimonas ramus TaxID=690164 RepID=A0A917QEE9_9HYPH|nr:EAL domain-containing protein [Salinarimonas ramus]GGK46830.1 putative signaling protein [Salinarimonas ramus]
MRQLYLCIVEPHDIALTLLALLVCVLSTLTAFRLYQRARASNRRTGLLLVLAMGLVAGLGTWSTHFVAMLAYRPFAAADYGIGGTLASLAVAIVVMGCGSVVAFASASAVGRLAGGALVGAGVAAMHYLGMSALVLPLPVAYDPGFVAVSVVAGCVLGALAFAGAGDATRRAQVHIGAGGLAAAIAAMHFTGMASIETASVVDAVAGARHPKIFWLAAGIVVAMLLVLGIGLAAILVDARARRGEATRLRAFADAAFEGLVVAEGDVVVDANAAACALTGRMLAEIRGTPLSTLLGPALTERLAQAADAQTVEGALRAPDGTRIPVTVARRTLECESTGRVVVALRDLREREAASQRIRFLASHDALTGLPNRAAFADALQEALEEADAGTSAGPIGQVAVLCVDLDHFKSVNDLHGHAVGDAVLVEAGRRMRPLLSAGATLARLGGDEFAIVKPLRDRAAGEAVALGERLLKAFEGEFVLDGGVRARPGASIGLAISPEDGTDPQRLLANADMALYRAKSEGRGRLRTFDAAMDARLRERYALAAELREAIPRGELSLHFQPQIAAPTGEVVGFEALVRWHHPTRGLVPPAEFIPLAEENGLVLQLGEWVLARACAEAATWERPYKVAVNLSPVQFQSHDLPETVWEILLATGLAPARLELEVTETAIIDDMDRALNILRRLKNLGVTIAMDDFGTGYSSLATLQAFPFDKIKIDRSFVSRLESQPQAASIVRAVLGLGRSLGMGVVAEGVETHAQMRFLSAESCDEVQGYLFGRPMPARDIPELRRGGDALDAADGGSRSEKRAGNAA